MTRQEELRRLAKIADLGSDRQMQELIKTASLSKNPQLAARLGKNLSTRAAMLYPEHNPFVIAPSEEGILTMGEIESGRILTGRGNGPVFRPLLETWNRHVGVFAPTGGGKSFLMAYLALQAIRRVTVWIFDTEREYARYLVSRTLPDALLVVNVRDFRKNFFGWPNACDPKTYLLKKAISLRELFYLRDSSTNMLIRVVTDLLEKKGHFTISDVLKEIKSLRMKVDRRLSDARETLENRFTALQIGMPGLDTTDSHDLDFLQTRSVIFDISTLSQDLAAVFISDILLYLIESRRHSTE